MEPTPYQGWPNCLRLANEHVEMIVTTDVGPRIMRYASPNGPNMLYEAREHLGQTGGDEWRSYGGHRLWHAPEAMPRTYQPDNAPVAHAHDGKWLSLTAHVEERTGLQKEICLYPSPDSCHVKLLHRITNRGMWPVRFAPWTLTVMAPGGRAIFPQEPYRPHPDALLPARPVTLWSYTRMDDPRWTWGSRYIQLRQDSNASIPQKVGILNKPGWAAYWIYGTLFIKRFACLEGAEYPDFGCNMESYTDANMLELESLGPLQTLEPGATADHIEHWFLFSGVPDAETDDELDALLQPFLQKSLRLMNT